MLIKIIGIKKKSSHFVVSIKAYGEISKRHFYRSLPCCYDSCIKALMLTTTEGIKYRLTPFYNTLFESVYYEYEDTARTHRAIYLKIIESKQPNKEFANLNFSVYKDVIALKALLNKLNIYWKGVGSEND